MADESESLELAAAESERLAQRCAAVQAATGHSFSDTDLLIQGLTHASACSGQSDAGQRLVQHNERLEFLGDALLGAAVAQVLYHHHQQANEGFLSRCKSRLVSRKALAIAIDRHHLMAHAILGPQMKHGVPISVRANIAEGLLGAIYLDGGWAALCTAVEQLLAVEWQSISEDSGSDAKNALQMWCLEHHRNLPTYESERSGGSDHAPTFVATVSIADYSAMGEGGSRRAAETRAAGALIDQLRSADSA